MTESVSNAAENTSELFTPSSPSDALGLPVISTVAPRGANQVESQAVHNILIPKCHVSPHTAYHVTYLGILHSEMLIIGVCSA